MAIAISGCGRKQQLVDKVGHQQAHLRVALVDGAVDGDHRPRPLHAAHQRGHHRRQQTGHADAHPRRRPLHRGEVVRRGRPVAERLQQARCRPQALLTPLRLNLRDGRRLDGADRAQLLGGQSAQQQPVLHQVQQNQSQCLAQKLSAEVLFESGIGTGKKVGEKECVLNTKKTVFCASADNNSSSNNNNNNNNNNCLLLT